MRLLRTNRKGLSCRASMRKVASGTKSSGAGQHVSPQPCDAVLFADDELPSLQKQEMQGKCHVSGCSRSLHDLREFHQRFQICDEHIKVCESRSPCLLQRVRPCLQVWFHCCSTGSLLPDMSAPTANDYMLFMAAHQISKSLSQCSTGSRHTLPEVPHNCTALSQASIHKPTPQSPT